LQPRIAADYPQIGSLRQTNPDMVVYGLKTAIHIFKTIVDLL